MTETPNQRSFAESWSLLALVFVIVAGFCGICAYVLLDLRRLEWNQARQAAANLATAIQADIARNVELYDHSLQGVAENYIEPGVADLNPRLRNRLLFDRVADAKHLGTMLLLDHQGRVTADLKTLNPIRQSHADEDYFLAHQQNPNQGLYMSHVDIDGAGDYVLGISRRVTNADGSFAGVVVGTMRLQYFRDTFRKMNLGPESSITLIRAEGLVLAREPYKASDYGRILPTSDFVFNVDREAGIGSLLRTSILDGVERLFVHARVGQLPLIVSVGISTKHITNGWRYGASVIGLLALVLCLITVTLVVILRAEARQKRELQEQLATLARTDALTKLANRRGFDLAAERECKRAERAGEYVGVLMIDADRFKDYNDRYGHQAGDELLARIAGCIADTARRGSDFAARLGGEEFAILIGDADAETLRQVADNVRSAVEALQVPHPSLPTGHASVSIGVACIKPGSKNLADLMQMADQALYKAKDLGRNTVVFDPSVLTSVQRQRRAA